ncbi:TonB-dependent receptor [Sphingomonas sp. M1-B02]|uniref:TonB-dependent receptor n=1 Tax=Sphingomonas sp. M1-B02 TaxID=3114300 RepID=UPI00223FB32A|nr:TonB-dependent receptor [Sphingomonas sp. S6-11]UZK64717.1 TonB-dependent receptor [Sphingomonas sp. S6-11]
MRGLSILLATTAVLLSPAAMAQDVPPSGDPVEEGEIIVTAQKREQNVQDVPVAITVVSGDDLASVGGSQLQDLTKLTPSLTITQGGDLNNNVISLRGVGTSAFSVGVEQSVLVIVDGVAGGLPGQGFNDLADIERVEVLRGPQSTLFGKSASAGVISVTTKAPTSRFSGNAEVMLTDDGEQRYSAGISGPITSTLGFRVNGSVGRFDGNIRELQSGNDINGRDTENVRAKLQFEPSSDFDATLIGYYTNTRTNCCGFVAIERTPGVVSSFGTPSTVSLAGITPGRDNFSVRVDPIPDADSESYGGSLAMNLAVGSHTLTQIFAMGYYNSQDLSDFDGAYGPALGLATGVFQSGTFEGETLSHELRLTSPSGGALQYVVGTYYARNENRRTFFRPGPVANANWYGRTVSETFALFGQADWRIAPGTTLIGGLRWNNENIGFQYQRFNSNGGNPPFFTSGKTDDSVITGKVGVQQDLSDDIMAFATYSRGYKGKGYDLTSSFVRPNFPASRPLEAETADSYEVGLRSTFLDRRVTLNVTGFWTDYSNFQSQTLEPGLGGAFILANVGSLRTRGVEADMLVRASNWLRLNASVAYVDAKIKSYPNGECYFGQTPAQGCVPNAVGGRAQDLSGSRLANSPEWKFNVGADMNIPLGSLPVDLTVNGNYTWQSGTFFALTNDPVSFQDSYGIANLSIGFEEKNDQRYSITFLVRNLFDENYFGTIRNDAGTFSGNPYPNPSAVTNIIGLRARDSARYLGVRLGVKY